MSLQIPDDHVLDSVVEIDDVLQEISSLEKEKAHIDAVKKYRARVADEKLGNISSRLEEYREVILKTMLKHSPDKKTLSFPSVGKVSIRKPKQKWVVEDELLLLNWLEKNEVRDSVVEITERVNKKKLDGVLDKLSKKEELVGVKLDQGKESISITLDKNCKSKDEYEEDHQKFSSEGVKNIEDLADLSI